MFGFPIGNGNAGFNDFVEKFTNNADSGFPKIQQREVFYSIRDGNWNDISIWQTASGRIGNFPTSIDDVYIRHTINNSTLNNVSINNLFITGVFNYGNTGYNMSVFGNLKCTGTINQTNANISLYGSENYINTYNFNTVEPAITYARNDGIPQPIMPITHGRLVMNGISEKYLVADFVQGTSGNTNLIQSTFDTRGYNVTFTTGVTFFTSTGDFIANGSTLVFEGTCTWIGIRRYEVINSIIEFRNGFIWNPPIGTFANSVINFTTNTQNVQVNFSGVGAHIIDANSVNIVGNITLNIAGGSDYLVLNCPINGTTASSNLTNKAFLQFGNAASVPSMTTGVFDRTTFANTVGYIGNYSATIPSLFTNFHNLTISGTGTKTLGVNTTLNGNLVVSGGIFELSTYNLTITGTSSISAGYLKKSGAGNVIFVGLATISYAVANALDFTTGNPSVEVRGGITYGLNTASTYQINGGLGTWTFSTNNQSITGNQGVSWIRLYNALIKNNITLTIATTNNVMVQIDNEINGETSTSKLLGGTNARIALNSNIQPMTTGIWDFTTNVCFVRYMSTSNQTIWHSTYSHLELENNSTKTLSANTTINNNLNCLTGNINSIFELSTYSLSVNGTSALAGKISKSGAGNILFVGLVTWNDLVSGIDFSAGNPTIETRNGFRYLNGSASVTMILGSSVWNFTTNNQSLYGTAVGTLGNFSGGTFNIANDITLTIGSTLITNATINGGNSNSKLLMGAPSSLNYQSATQPMITGILDTSTNLNTWIYGLNNQNIKGSPTTSPKQVYRNLTLNGTGVKTLQGYVSVQNTYTLTAPATLALNGFTLTNP